MSENLIQIQNLSKSYGTRVLFDKAYASINEGEHVGVIGANGAGKSTLFKILVKDEEPDTGQVIRSSRLRLAYLSQHDEWKPGDTGMSYLEANITAPLWSVLAKSGDLGLNDELLAKPILSLSGGYRMRIKILALIGQEPNLLLLDEPTNYLDLETTLLMESFLQSYDGAFLLISHDREFLRRTTDHILEIEDQSMTKFNGNLDDYFEQKELLRAQLSAQAMTQDKKKKEILDFVNRFGAKATKAKQAQSRLKSLAKMESIDIRALPRIAAIRIPTPENSGKVSLKLKNVQLGYDSRTILSGVNSEILRGDHLAVIGLNGAGKSTLLKAISGALKPQKGEVEFGYQVRTAFYAQHVIEDLNLRHTVFESLSAAAHSSVLPQEVKDLAGSLLFSGDDIKKSISVLSGGEKSRVALGRILLKKTSCLILDEPTNHLDFQTVEALTLALQKFEGTVIVVSHDRSFVKRVGTKILEVANGGVNLYPGAYEDYLTSLSRALHADAGFKGQVQSATQTKEGPSPQVVESFEQKKERDKRVRFCERRVPLLESDIQKIRAQMDSLSDEIAGGATGKRASDVIDQLGELQKKLNQSETEWMQLSEELEGYSK